MRQDKERELMAELRGYYTHYPNGHGLIEFHDKWRKATAIWNHITKLSAELSDSHKTLRAFQEQLKDEGVIPSEQQESQTNAEVREVRQKG